MDLPIGDADRMELAAMDEALLAPGNGHPGFIAHVKIFGHWGGRRRTYPQASDWRIVYRAGTEFSNSCG